jgi:hypothetical protein
VSGFGGGGRIGGRGASVAGASPLLRLDRPSRCTLPITALRVTEPSSLAICEADLPSFHIFFSSSTRSSVQDMLLAPERGGPGRSATAVLTFAHSIGDGLRYKQRPEGKPVGAIGVRDVIRRENGRASWAPAPFRAGRWASAASAA